MNRVLPEDELLRACAELFGPAPVMGPGFLAYLQPSGLKAVFRRRARETHPDLVLGLAQEQQREQAEAFHRVRRAYEDLVAYLTLREQYRCEPGPSLRQARPFQAHRPRPAPNWTPPWPDREQVVPERPLLFGHYLQFHGIISWQDIVRALTWQRLNRPRLGELGHLLGWLEPEDIPRISRHQRLGQRFGASAVELGLLDPLQLERLVQQQLLRQKRFGGYFVESRKVSRQELYKLLSLFHQHNFRCRRD